LRRVNAAHPSPLNSVPILLWLDSTHIYPRRVNICVGRSTFTRTRRSDPSLKHVSDLNSLNPPGRLSLRLSHVSLLSYAYKSCVVHLALSIVLLPLLSPLPLSLILILTVILTLSLRRSNYFLSYTHVYTHPLSHTLTPSLTHLLSRRSSPFSTSPTLDTSA